MIFSAVGLELEFQYRGGGGGFGVVGGYPRVTLWLILHLPWKGGG